MRVRYPLDKHRFNNEVYWGQRAFRRGLAARWREFARQVDRLIYGRS
jgi:hypothetical protein